MSLEGERSDVLLRTPLRHRGKPSLNSIQAGSHFLQLSYDILLMEFFDRTRWQDIIQVLWVRLRGEAGT